MSAPFDPFGWEAERTRRSQSDRDRELTELLVKLRTIQTYARMAIATRRVSEADAYDAATSPETMAEVLEQVLARLDPLFAEASPPTRADPRTP